MKLGLVTKLDKRNKTMSKKIDDNIMLESCDVIAIFLLCHQFKVDSGRVVRKTYIFINSNLLSHKN